MKNEQLQHGLHHDNPCLDRLENNDFPSWTFGTPARFTGSNMAALEKIAKYRSLDKGEHLYRMGDALRAIYVIRQGSIKSSLLCQDGRTQVVAFLVPGEILGLDGICEGRHPSDATALETTDVCELPFGQLERLARAVPSLHRYLLRQLSREIDLGEKKLFLLGRLNAEARVATFLLDLSQRYGRANIPAKQLKLPMTRQDLGDHLGIALETVSRVLSHFQDKGLLQVQGRRINLLDLNRLQTKATAETGSL